jgi:signal transduction histidine kinase
VPYLVTRRTWNDDRQMIAAMAVSAGGISVGLGTLALVRGGPGGALTGSSPLAAAGLLAAGWLAITVGLVMRRRRPGNLVGVLLVAAGFAWFVTEWNNPAAGSAIVFTVGLLCYASCPPLVAHAVLSYPGGRLGSRVEAIVVVAAYVGSLAVLGLGPALVFEPADQGCAQCATNLLAITSNAELVEAFNRTGVWLGAAWATALAVLAGWRLVRSTPAARRVRMPVLLPAVAYLGAVAATYVHALDRGFLSNDELARRLWSVQAVTLISVGLGLVVEWIRARRARSAIAGMVVELAEAPPPGGLRDALARALGDPDLEIAYPDIDGRSVDFRGSPVSGVAAAGRATTALVSGDQTIAVVLHRSDLLGDRRLVEEAVTAARLAFENERLHAEAGAQLADLRSSRERLVAASDAERRRLERDLHDGAQQRLVGLTLATRLMRTQLEQEECTDLAARVAAAETELRRVVDDVRELASGLHPAVLTDYGLAAAVRALAETSTLPVRLVDATEERFPSAAETTAFLVVAQAAKMGPVSVNVARRGANLVIEVDAAGLPTRLVDLEDRVGVLGGTLTIESAASGTWIRAVIPCA